jgi:hypothetical protein
MEYHLISCIAETNGDSTWENMPLSDGSNENWENMSLSDDPDENNSTEPNDTEIFDTDEGAFPTQLSYPPELLDEIDSA